MTTWVDRELVLAIHERQLAEHGGATGIRDSGLLDSALARPLQMLAYGHPEPDLAELATALAHGLARNHPFVDGNKRTAYVAMRTFLVLNGTDTVALPEEKYSAVLALAEGRQSASEFAVWLRANLRTSGVHEPTLPYVVRKRAPAARKPPPRKARTRSKSAK
jgi:death-on-curing protein